jgi:hypothetical protein
MKTEYGYTYNKKPNINLNFSYFQEFMKASYYSFEYINNQKVLSRCCPNLLALTKKKENIQYPLVPIIFASFTNIKQTMQDFYHTLFFSVLKYENIEDFLYISKEETEGDILTLFSLYKNNANFNLESSKDFFIYNKDVKRNNSLYPFLSLKYKKDFSFSINKVFNLYNKDNTKSKINIYDYKFTNKQIKTINKLKTKELNDIKNIKQFNPILSNDNLKNKKISKLRTLNMNKNDHNIKISEIKSLFDYKSNLFKTNNLKGLNTNSKINIDDSLQKIKTNYKTFQHQQFHWNVIKQKTNINNKKEDYMVSQPFQNINKLYIKNLKKRKTSIVNFKHLTIEEFYKTLLLNKGFQVSSQSKAQTIHELNSMKLKSKLTKSFLYTNIEKEMFNLSLLNLKYMNKKKHYVSFYENILLKSNFKEFNNKSFHYLINKKDYSSFINKNILLDKKRVNLLRNSFYKNLTPPFPDMNVLTNKSIKRTNKNMQSPYNNLSAKLILGNDMFYNKNILTNKGVNSTTVNDIFSPKKKYKRANNKEYGLLIYHPRLFYANTNKINGILKNQSIDKLHQWLSINFMTDDKFNRILDTNFFKTQKIKHGYKSSVLNHMLKMNLSPKPFVTWDNKFIFKKYQALFNTDYVFSYRFFQDLKLYKNHSIKKIKPRTLIEDNYNFLFKKIKGTNIKKKNYFLNQELKNIQKNSYNNFIYRKYQKINKEIDLTFINKKILNLSKYNLSTNINNFRDMSKQIENIYLAKHYSNAKLIKKMTKVTPETKRMQYYFNPLKKVNKNQIYTDYIFKRIGTIRSSKNNKEIDMFNNFIITTKYKNKITLNNNLNFLMKESIRETRYFKSFIDSDLYNKNLHIKQGRFFKVNSKDLMKSKNIFTYKSNIRKTDIKETYKRISLLEKKAEETINTFLSNSKKNFNFDFYNFVEWFNILEKQFNTINKIKTFNIKEKNISEEKKFLNFLISDKDILLSILGIDIINSRKVTNIDDYIQTLYNAPENCFSDDLRLFVNKNLNNVFNNDKTAITKNVKESFTYESSLDIKKKNKNYEDFNNCIKVTKNNKNTKISEEEALFVFKTINQINEILREIVCETKKIIDRDYSNLFMFNPNNLTKEKFEKMLYKILPEIDKMSYLQELVNDPQGKDIILFDISSQTIDDEFLEQKGKGLDELILPHEDFKYNSLKEELFDYEKGEPINPVKKINDTTFIAKLPVNHPIGFGSELGREYVDINVNILKMLLDVFYMTWQNKIFEYGVMDVKDGINKLLKYLEIFIEYRLPKSMHKEAYRCFQMIRWYGEQTIIELSQYKIKFKYGPWKSNLHTKEINCDHELENVIINEGYVLQNIDTTGFVSLNLDVKEEGFITAALRLKGNVSVYINNQRVKEYNKSSKINIPIEKGNLNLKIMFDAELFKLGNIIIDNCQFEDIVTTYEYSPGQANYGADKIMKRISAYYMVTKENFKEMENYLQGAISLRELSNKLISYYNLHHVNKQKGKRKIIKKGMM